jgi:hypothetical protein
VHSGEQRRSTQRFVTGLQPPRQNPSSQSSPGSTTPFPHVEDRVVEVVELVVVDDGEGQLSTTCRPIAQPRIVTASELEMLPLLFTSQRGGTHSPKPTATLREASASDDLIEPSPSASPQIDEVVAA